MRFFFDRCMPYRMAHVVQAYEGKNGHGIRHHDDDPRFRPTTPDVEWIKALAADGAPRWIVLSGDGRILKKKVERQALREAALPFFCLAHQWMNMPIHDYAWKSLKARPAVASKADPRTSLIYELSAGKSL